MKGDKKTKRERLSLGLDLGYFFGCDLTDPASFEAEGCMYTENPQAFLCIDQYASMMDTQSTCRMLLSVTHPDNTGTRSLPLHAAIA